MAYSLSYRPTSILGILGDPPFGISIMAYCGLHMVYIWFTYGLHMVYPFWDLSFGQTHRDVCGKNHSRL